MRQLLLYLLATLALSAPARATLNSRASVEGDARGNFVIGCSSCSPVAIPLAGQSLQSASGGAFAAIDYSSAGQASAALDGYSLGGGVSYAAQAGFEGVLQTPALRARSSADNAWAHLLADPDKTPVGIDEYLSYARADTVRLYSYVGSAPTRYTFAFQVDGNLTEQRASLFAAASIYWAYAAPGFETGRVASEYASQNGEPGLTTPFSRSFVLGIDVKPGDSFYLIAHLGMLSDIAYEPGLASADAFNTLRVTGVGGGNPALLLAAPVPEPGKPWLLLLGLSSLGLAINRPKPRPRAAS